MSRTLIVAALLLVSTIQAAAVTISTVPVGDIGNPGEIDNYDTWVWGGVDYHFRIAASPRPGSPSRNTQSF